MRYRYLIIVAIALLGIFAIGNIANAYGEDVTPTPSPSTSCTGSPSPSPTATPTPPASHKTVRTAHRVQRRARHWLKQWNFARNCWGMSPKHVRLRHPSLRAPESIWHEYIVSAREARDTFKEKYLKLYGRAKNPGGSGVERWRPLARWHWPHYLVDKLLSIMRRESGGNARILCGGYILPKGAGDGSPDSRAGGLLQLKPAPRHWADPDFNLRYGYFHKYLPALNAWDNGWTPWGG